MYITKASKSLIIVLLSAITLGGIALAWKNNPYGNDVPAQVNETPKENKDETVTYKGIKCFTEDSTFPYLNKNIKDGLCEKYFSRYSDRSKTFTIFTQC